MKKELDTKKPTKPAVIPLKENDKNEMKKRIDEINSKLKEKQTNVQRIVKEYQEFDINTSVQQKLINLKTEMLEHEQLNADIILLIDAVLNKRSQGKLHQKDSHHGKFLRTKKATKPTDDEDEDESEDSSTEEQSEDNQAQSEETKCLQAKRIQKSDQIKFISQIKKIKSSDLFSKKPKKQLSNQNAPPQSQKATSDNIKPQAVLPQSKDIKKQQPLSIWNKTQPELQNTNRIVPSKPQFHKSTEEVNKKIEKNDKQEFQRYMKELKKASIDGNLDIPKYFLDKKQFHKRLNTKSFNIRQLDGKKDKLFVIKLVKSLLNNQTRASQMLVLPESSVRRLVEGSNHRREIIWKNKSAFNKANQEEDSECQSSDEDSESEDDEKSIEADGDNLKIEDEGLICSSENIRTPDLEIKEEEEFLREHEWLKKEGLLQNLQINQEEGEQLKEHLNYEQEIKIEEESNLNENVMLECSEELELTH